MKLSRKGPEISADPEARALVPQKMQAYLASPSADVVRFVIESDGRIQGIILARRKQEAELRILTLNTISTPKRPVLARVLVQELMRWARDEHFRKSVISYSKESTDSEFIENVFTSCGWTKPESRTVIFRSTPDDFLKAPFLKKRPLPSGYRIDRWVDLGEEKMEEFRRSHDGNDAFPTELAPWNFEEMMEPELSLALLKDEQIVGFQITHRSSSDTLSFLSGWVHPGLVGRGRLWNMVREIVEKMDSHGIQFGEQRVPSKEFPETADFLRKRQRPYATTFIETFGMEYNFQTGAETLDR